MSVVNTTTVERIRCHLRDFVPSDRYYGPDGSASAFADLAADWERRGQALEELHQAFCAYRDGGYQLGGWYRLEDALDAAWAMLAGEPADTSSKSDLLAGG